MNAIEAKNRSIQIKAGTSIIRRELDLMGSIVVGGVEIVSGDMLNYVDSDVKDNIIRMLLCDPDEAFIEAHTTMGGAVVQYCEAHPLAALQAVVQYSREVDPIIYDDIIKDRVKLGMSPSAKVEDWDCRGEV